MARARIKQLEKTLDAAKLKTKRLQVRFPVYVHNAEVYPKQCEKNKAKFDKGEAKAKEERAIELANLQSLVDSIEKCGPCATLEEYKQTMKMTRKPTEGN